MNIVPINPVQILCPWQATLYLHLTNPLTAAQASRSVQGFGAQLDLLRARGDGAAVAGLTTVLRYDLLKAAAVPANSTRRLDRKVALLAAQRSVWADVPMAALMIETAIQADADGLGLRVDIREGLLRRLRGRR